MANDGFTSAISRDWERREVLESVALDIVRLGAFLNSFARGAESRLAALSGRLETLERAFECAAAAAHHGVS